MALGELGRVGRNKAIRTSVRIAFPARHHGYLVGNIFFAPAQKPLFRPTACVDTYAPERRGGFLILYNPTARSLYKAAHKINLPSLADNQF